jgi:hypothetical protein
MKKESGFKLRSGNKPSPAKMFGGALNALKGRRVRRALGGAASMLGGSSASMGALGMLRRKRRGGSPNMAARVAGALGMRNRQIPGKPVGPNRGGFLGAIRPIAGKALVRRR